MADGTAKPIDQVRVGDTIANSVPGVAGTEAHEVTAVIVTHTDHDFVDLTIKSTAQRATDQPVEQSVTKAGAKSLAKKVARKAAFGLAASAAVLGALGASHGHGADQEPATKTVAAVSSATPGQSAKAAEGGTSDVQGAHLTTTFHHPFYDETQSAFVDAKDLKAGDVLQTPTGTAEVADVELYHADTTTYDLTIGRLHTYYVEAGNTPVLVHNCKTDEELQADADSLHETVRTLYGDRAYNGTTVATGHIDGELVYSVNRNKTNPLMRDLADQLGYRRVSGKVFTGAKQTDAEQIMLNAVDDGEVGTAGRLATSRIPCGPRRQNCAARLAQSAYSGIKVVGRYGG